MAATTTADAHSELINSLSQDEIPIKLRCAICSRLAVNAFRLPCCEQAICETCQSTLPSSCPVCEHTPVAAEDCKPNKSLRTTIKVFLRTEEKKREALKLKEVKESPQSALPETVATPIEEPTPVDSVEDKQPSPVPASDQVQDASRNVIPTPHNAEQDVPQPSIEEIAPGQEPNEETVDAGPNQTEAEGEIAQADEKDGNEDAIAAQPVPQAPGMAAGMGFDASAGGFPAMGFGGDFNQMQMMMAMQNGGMGPNSFGNFPMMGMPGMGMDPMAMQNMFMNGGFGAGMNGMNMSMGTGMGGFDGSVGAGFNNEWNGQQSWNVAPDNFNHPNAAGMGTGDYGSNNSGYNSHATRYNQGNYGHGNQYNEYGGYGYQSRGRGRGRGGYGRGGFSHQFPQQFGSGEGFNRPSSETGAIPTGPKADATAGADSNVDEFGREIRQISEAKDGAAAEAALKDDNDATPAQERTGTDANQDSTSKDEQGHSEDHTPKPIQTLDEAQGFAQNGYNGHYNQGMSRGYGPGFAGRGGFNPTLQPVKPVDVPINAPTGPKAMRDGLPNTGLSGLRVRGYQGPNIPSSRTNDNASAPPEPQSAVEAEQAGEKSLPHSKERSKERQESRPRSRSRSGDRRSRSRDRRHRRHRHRSTSMSDDEKDAERRRQRRRERHREDAGSKEIHVNEEDKETEDERSRSVSPSGSKRSGHRSRRDKDKYRERERDSDREYKSSSHKHRRHRDDRSRSRDRDRDHRHRHSRRGSEVLEDRPDRSIPPTPVDSEAPSGGQSTAANGTIEIKGAGGRRKPTLDEIVIPTGPRKDRISSARDKDYDRGKENRDSRRHRDEDDGRHRSSRQHRESDRERERDRDRAKDKEREKERPRAPPTAPSASQDPHTLEREARNRERLLKEAQRIAGLSGMAGAKRGREDDDPRKGRKKGRRGDEGDEARLARLEAERESARWN